MRASVIFSSGRWVVPSHRSPWDGILVMVDVCKSRAARVSGEFVGHPRRADAGGVRAAFYPVLYDQGARHLAGPRDRAVGGERSWRNDCRRIGARGGFTTTGNEHDAVRFCASVVLQVTAVEPTGKLMPLGGMQLVVKGAAPPVTTGLPNVTDVAALVVAAVPE